MTEGMDTPTVAQKQTKRRAAATQGNLLPAFRYCDTLFDKIPSQSGLAVFGRCHPGIAILFVAEKNRR